MRNRIRSASVSREKVLKIRYNQFRKYGFDRVESEALTKSDYKFSNPLLRQRILRRNRKVQAVMEADKKVSLEEAIGRAVREDPLLKPPREPEPKSGIVRLLRRLR